MMLVDILAGIGEVALMAALARAQAESLDLATITHDGSAARFVIMDPSTRVLIAGIVNPGDTVRVPRSHRLLMEPLDSVRMRALCCVERTWSQS